MSFLQRVAVVRSTIGLPEGSVGDTLHAAICFMGIPTKEGMVVTKRI